MRINETIISKALWQEALSSPWAGLEGTQKAVNKKN